MPTVYEYELFNGKQVLGYYRTLYLISGNILTIPELPILKERYDIKNKTISIPIGVRLIADRGTEYTYRIYLDVRRKSKRQINIIKRMGI